MKLVIVKQAKGKYLFKVPSGYSVAAGDILMLNTQNGSTTGVAMCDSFCANNDIAEEIMRSFGTQENRMKFVIGKGTYTMFDIESEYAREAFAELTGVKV